MNHLPTVPGALQPGDRARLAAVLNRSRQLGYLGPGSVEAQIDRSVALLPVALGAMGVPGGAEIPAHLDAMDLGSGGGLPGLVLAVVTPAWRWTLLDGSRTRTGFLDEAVGELGLEGHVTVVCARAEDAGRSGLRASFDLLVARGFAGPAVTAECAAPFLRPGGRALITEPPGGAPGRWSETGLASVGMTMGASTVAPVATQVLHQREHCPDQFPRRTGVPSKRPLWKSPSPGGETSRD